MDAAAQPWTAPAASRGAIDWPLTLLPGVMLGVLMLRPVWDFDIFWQLRLGLLMGENGGLLSREPFSAPHLGEPLPALSWLAQLIMAKVWLAIGWTGLRLCDALLWAGGFWATGFASWRRGGSARGLCVGLALAFLAAQSFASLRPQSFALLCFGALLALLRLDWPARRAAPVGLALLVLWQNLHPSVSIAVVALAAYALPGCVPWLRGRAAAPPTAPMALAAIAVLALFATPDGWSLLAVCAHNASAARGIGVAEWLPLWSPLNRQFAPLVVLAGLAAAGLLWSGRSRLHPGELALLLVLSAMTVLAIRFAPFWAMALIAPLSRALGDKGARPAVAALPLLAAPPLLAGLAALAVPGPFSAQIPTAAIASLRDAGASGTVFTDNYGGPVLLLGDPDWRVAYDGRYWRYSEAEWRRFAAIQHGRIGLGQVDAIYRPGAFLLSVALNPTLIARLRADPAHWRQVWSDDRVAAFVRAAI